MRLYSMRCFFVLSLLLGMAIPANAAEVLVTASFKPDAANPGHNTFTNTTPSGFYCRWMPEQCVAHNIYMFDLPVNITKIYVKGAGTRKHWYFAAPAERSVELRNERGSRADVLIGISAVSGRATPGINTNPLFTASPSGGCSYVRTSNNGSVVAFGWNIRNPTLPTPCSSYAGGVNGLTLEVATDVFGIGLRITSPSPLQLQNGIYTGEITYSVGGLGADFDFGDNAVTTDNSLTLRFQFTVAHDLKISTAPGADTIRLRPLGGWARWSEHGITPKALQSDLPFTITGSAPFSLKLDCEFPVAEQCAIRSGVDGDLAPVDIAISMPGIRSEATGSDANRYRLRANTGRETFMPTSPVAHRPSRLHFNVDGEPMRRMLDQPGSHWQGRATLIFDTEID